HRRGLCWRQIDDEPKTVLVVRRQQECLGLRGLVELEDEPQLPARPRSRTQSGDGALRLVEAQARSSRAPDKIDDHALGIAEREHAMLGGAAELEDDAGAFRTGPGADVLDGSGARSCAIDEKRHGYARLEPPPS